VEDEKAFTFGHRYSSNSEEIETFKNRQREDMRRRQVRSDFYRQPPFHERYVQNIEVAGDLAYSSGSEHGSTSDSGEEGWRNAEGDRLRDFGVDEEIEFYDEDDIPLAALVRLRKDRAGAQPHAANL
jgi:palmitoyltransferase